MKFFLQLCIFNFLCAAAFAAPPPIVVNGLMTIFGDARVLFKIDGNNFMLASGEQRAGIRVVSIDVQKGVVQFDNHGELQTIFICATPDLTAPDSLSVPQKNSSAKTSRRSPDFKDPANAASAPVPSSVFISKDQPGHFSAPAVVPKNSGDLAVNNGLTDVDGHNSASDTSDAGSSDGSSPGNKPVAADAKNNLPDTWWYRAAAQLEAARLGHRRQCAQWRASGLSAYPVDTARHGCPPHR